MNSKNNYLKLEMLDNFLNYVNELYDNFKKNEFNSNEFTFQINRYSEVWKSCRIDLKNFGDESNSVSILGSDNDFVFTFPDWFCDNKGHGMKIESNIHKINFKLKCIGDGKLTIWLKGIDFRNYEQLRTPVYISYNKLRINDEILFNGDKLHWHDESYKFEIDCKNGEMFDFDIEFNTIYDFFPELLDLINDFSKISEFNYPYDQLISYFEDKKLFLNEDLNNDFRGSLKRIDVENEYLYNRLINLENQFNIFKEKNNEIIESYDLLFNNIFKYYKLEPDNLLYYSRELTKEVLDLINNVCKKHNLKWWLYGGTLLGAYRHKGFIPWDDDCDIAMIRSDYEKFYQLFLDELKTQKIENIFISRETITSNNVFLPFTKIEYRIGNKLLSFIDLFPADFISKIDDNIEFIYQLENKKLRNDLRKGVDRSTALNNAFQKLNISNEKTDKIISGVEDSVFSIVDYTTIFPLTETEFEDRYYPCPNNSKKYVQTCYGENFMKIPSVVNNHGFLPHIERFENVEDLLKTNFEILHEKNINFR